jgi:hypothetical protein
MEKNPNIRNPDSVNIVSRPQESYNCNPPKTSSKCKNMGLSIAQALILTLVSRRLFIWQFSSIQLFAITTNRNLFMRKRVT